MQVHRGGRWENVDLITEATSKEFKEWCASRGHPIVNQLPDYVLEDSPLGLSAMYGLRVGFVQDMEAKGTAMEKVLKEFEPFNAKYGTVPKLRRLLGQGD